VPASESQCSQNAKSLVDLEQKSKIDKNLLIPQILAEQWF
jgi:hypothetical protein